MKKLILFLLFPVFAFGQTVTPSWKVFGAGSHTIQYSFPGQTGSAKSVIDSVSIYARFKMRNDSVLNDGFVTHGYFNKYTLKKSDTGTTSLPSIYSLQHTNWQQYGTYTFNNSVSFAGVHPVNLNSNTLSNIGQSTYADILGSGNYAYIENYNGGLRVNNQLGQVGFFVNPATNRIETNGTVGVGSGKGYAYLAEIPGTPTGGFAAQAYVTPAQLGADSTGVVDALTAFNLAKATGKAIWIPQNHTYKLSSTFTMAANGRLFGNGTIKFAGITAIKHNTGSTIEGIRFRGNKHNATSRVEYAVMLRASNGTKTINCSFDSVATAAFYADSTAGVANFRTVNLVANNFFQNSTVAIKTGIRGEYVNNEGNLSFGCDTGVYRLGGNGYIVGGEYLNGTVGLYDSNDGVNGAHAEVTGAVFNHNTKNLDATGITATLGSTYTGCSFQVGKIYITNSGNISFNGGDLNFASGDSIINNNSTIFITNVTVHANPHYSEVSGGTHTFRINRLIYAGATAADIAAWSLVGVLGTGDFPNQGTTITAYFGNAAGNGQFRSLNYATDGGSSILPIANGGTGSATQPFVDLTTTQASIAGTKTFASIVATLMRGGGGVANTIKDGAGTTFTPSVSASNSTGPAGVEAYGNDGTKQYRIGLVADPANSRVGISYNHSATSPVFYISSSTGDKLTLSAAGLLGLPGYTTANGLLYTDGSGNVTQSQTMPNGTLATTQAAADNSTKLATTAYVDRIAQISGSFSGAGTATTVFTVTIGSTQANNTYKVQVTPTSALSAALFYVTNKTTTTFDVTYLAGLTGTVTFDWSVMKP